jgi:hypothetical protein
MSREQWEFEEDGYLFHEKGLDGFFPDLFDRWKRIGSNHIVSIILFTRLLIDAPVDHTEQHDLQYNPSTKRWFKDFYKVIHDWDTRNDWNDSILTLKSEFIEFRREILEEKKGECIVIRGDIARSKDGNILEVLNMALNCFDKHYVDRDLIRTGLCVMVVTPSNGVFNVDKKLLRMTFERMTDNGIPLDLVCLSRPPLHIAPLFVFQSRFPPSIVNTYSSKGEKLSGAEGSRSTKYDYSDSSRVNDNRIDPKSLLYYDETIEDGPLYDYYASPHWIETSYYDSERTSFKRNCRFVPQCKLYSLQDIGISGESNSLYPIPFLTQPTIDFGPLSNLTKIVSPAVTVTPSATAEATPTPTEQFSTHNIPSTVLLPLNPEAYDEGVFQSEDRRVLKMRPLNKPRSIRDLNYYEKNHSSIDDDFIQRSVDESNTSSHDLSSSLPLSRSFPKPPHRFNLMDTKNDNYLSSRLNVSKNYNSKGIADSGDSENSSKFQSEEKSAIGSLNHPPSTHTKPITIKFKAQESKANSSTPKNSYQNNSIQSSPGSDFQRHSFKVSPKSVQSKSSDQQILLNPFTSIRTNSSSSTPSGRWRHIYTNSEGQDSTKWQSLCAPACLPLTTDYYPTPDELAENYQEYTYTLSPNDEDSPYSSATNDPLQSASNLLKELISQRLAQGFQLIMFNNDQSMNSGNGFPVPNEEFVVNLQKSDGKKVNGFSIYKPYYLIMGNHVHRLFYDNQGQNIQVKRFVKRIEYNTASINYKCNVWYSTGHHYELRNLSFSYPQLNTYNWNYLDHLISGYQDDLTDGLRFWRARFVILPNDSLPNPNLFAQDNQLIDTLDEEELRVAGFLKFLDQLQKVCLNLDKDFEGDKKQLDLISNLSINFTTFSPSSYFASESKGIKPSNTPKRGFNFIGSEKLTRESKLTSILSALTNPNHGIKIMNRRWHLKLFENVFVGAELCDWLLSHLSDIQTRDEAIQFGNVLLQKGAIEHSRGKHCFLDGYYFYRIKSDQTAKSTTKSGGSWFRNHRANSVVPSEKSNNSTPISEKSEIKLSEPDSDSNKSSSNLNQPQTRVQLSRSMVIDLDLSRKSNRPEKAFLHFDTFYNPHQAFHFQIHWLGCTARLIDDLLQNWSRQAERCGLKLIEAPVSQMKIASNEKPFQAPIIIPFSVPPPSLNDLDGIIHPTIITAIQHDYFAVQLLKDFGFYLDLESDARFEEHSGIPVYSYQKPPVERCQFIHKSGIAIVQILPNLEGYLWETNRLYNPSNVFRTPTTNSNASSMFNSMTLSVGSLIGDAPPSIIDSLLQNLSDYCNSSIRLESFWDQCKQKLTTQQGLESVLDNFPEDLSINLSTSLSNETSRVQSPSKDLEELHLQIPQPILESEANEVLGSPPPRGPDDFNSNTNNNNN